MEQQLDIDRDKININHRGKERIQGLHKDIQLKGDNDQRTKNEREMEKTKDKTSKIEKRKDSKADMEHYHHSFNVLPTRNIGQEQVQNIAHPLRKFELPPAEEFDFDLQQQSTISQQIDNIQNVGINFSDNNKRQDNLLSVHNLQQPQLQQLQRAQFNVHFPHYNQTHKDIDWSENIRNVSSLDSQIKDQTLVGQSLIDCKDIPSSSPTSNLEKLSITSVNKLQNLEISELSDSTDQGSYQFSQPTFSPPTQSHLVEQMFELPIYPAHFVMHSPDISEIPSQSQIHKIPSNSDVLLKKSKLGAIPLVVANINIDTDNISDDHGDKDESEDAGDISG
ncbi:MAG: hypothetical protein EZS28_027422 [Streblomastix strix]|uniref:Uncharacterized protein n=1 Tax=Streblomastix strix TaxID=222440 RepID=A0A5J4V4M3_9EUKA|nr:MAG: hypothetical protein EZS28_027422 [Streblomastix strix]